MVGNHIINKVVGTVMGTDAAKAFQKYARARAHSHAGTHTHAHAHARAHAHAHMHAHRPRKTMPPSKQNGRRVA